MRNIHDKHLCYKPQQILDAVYKNIHYIHIINTQLINENNIIIIWYNHT